jgi:hypothetical protein
MGKDEAALNSATGVNISDTQEKGTWARTELIPPLGEDTASTRPVPSLQSLQKLISEIFNDSSDDTSDDSDDSSDDTDSDDDSGNSKMTPAHPLDPIDIPGLLEVAVEEYTDWHLSRVGTESFKENIKKARDIVLDNCLDLKQICGENPDFFVKQGVKIGAARRFVANIGHWIKHCEQGKASENGPNYCTQRHDRLPLLALHCCFLSLGRIISSPSA